MAIFPLTDTIVIFAVVAVLILVIPFAMAKIRMPALVGLLLAGAILGPNALHVLERDQSFILLGNVGLMFIMFMAALEIDLGVLKKLGFHALIFGILTFGIPLGAATPVALKVLGYATLPGILLASIFSSHSLIAYPQASRLGIGKNRAVVTAVGGTVLADTAALLILAVVVGMEAEGEITEAFWWRLGASVGIYVAAIFFGIPRLGRWLFRRTADDGNVHFAFVLAAVFVCAALAHTAGVEPIVGAFLAGLALGRLIPHNGTLMNRIVFVGEAIFIPFFLISVGMLLDARALFSGLGTWIMLLYMTIMVIVTKFAAAEVARLLLRFTKAESRVVFSLTLAQAAATLAVVQVGFNIGMFDETVVNGSIVMILVTCTMAPMVMARFGPEVQKRDAELAAATQTGPRQRVIVALRELASAQALVDLALLLRDSAQRQPLYLVHAAPDDEDVSTKLHRAEQMLHAAEALCAAADVPSEISTSVDHTIAAALRRATRELQGSHLVLDWDFAPPSGPSMLGATVDELVRDTRRNIVLFRCRHPMSTTTKVTLAIPPCPLAEEVLLRAVEGIKRVAQQLGAPVAVLADADTWARVRALVEGAKPEVKVSHHPLESWASLKQALLDRVSETDLLAIVGDREAPPEIARTPIEVAERFPGASMLLVFGDEQASVAALPASGAASSAA